MLAFTTSRFSPVLVPRATYVRATQNSIVLTSANIHIHTYRTSLPICTKRRLVPKVDGLVEHEEQTWETWNEKKILGLYGLTISISFYIYLNHVYIWEYLSISECLYLSGMSISIYLYLFISIYIYLYPFTYPSISVIDKPSK